MIPSFRLVALVLGGGLVVLSLIFKKRGLAVVYALMFGAFGILPENEINFFTQCMFLFCSLFPLFLNDSKAPVKTELEKIVDAVDMAEEVPNIYTRQEAEQYAALLEKAKELKKTG